MDENLYSLATNIGKLLAQKKLHLVTAESCTGGWVAQTITSVPNCSVYFDRGFVTYSNNSKQEMLGVTAEVLEKFGAVSEETAKEMAEGALKYSSADVSLSITGIAGPGGGSPQKPVGTVCFGWAFKGRLTKTTCMHFSGDREDVRRQAVEFVLAELCRIIKNETKGTLG